MDSKKLADKQEKPQRPPTIAVKKRPAAGPVVDPPSDKKRKTLKPSVVAAPTNAPMDFRPVAASCSSAQASKPLPPPKTKAKAKPVVKADPAHEVKVAGNRSSRVAKYNAEDDIDGNEGVDEGAKVFRSCLKTFELTGDVKIAPGQKRARDVLALDAHMREQIALSMEDNKEDPHPFRKLWADHFRPTVEALQEQVDEIEKPAYHNKDMLTAMRRAKDTELHDLRGKLRRVKSSMEGWEFNNLSTNLIWDLLQWFPANSILKAANLVRVDDDDEQSPEEAPLDDLERAIRELKEDYRGASDRAVKASVLVRLLVATAGLRIRAVCQHAGLTRVPRGIKVSKESKTVTATYTSVEVVVVDGKTTEVSVTKKVVVTNPKELEAIHEILSIRLKLMDALCDQEVASQILGHRSAVEAMSDPYAAPPPSPSRVDEKDEPVVLAVDAILAAYDALRATCHIPRAISDQCLSMRIKDPELNAAYHWQRTKVVRNVLIALPDYSVLTGEWFARENGKPHRSTGLRVAVVDVIADYVLPTPLSDAETGRHYPSDAKERIELERKRALQYAADASVDGYKELEAKEKKDTEEIHRMAAAIGVTIPSTVPNNYAVDMRKAGPHWKAMTLEDIAPLLDDGPDLNLSPPHPPINSEKRRSARLKGRPAVSIRAFMDKPWRPVFTEVDELSLGDVLHGYETSMAQLAYLVRQAKLLYKRRVALTKQLYQLELVIGRPQKPDDATPGHWLLSSLDAPAFYVPQAMSLDGSDPDAVSKRLNHELKCLNTEFGSLVHEIDLILTFGQYNGVLDETRCDQIEFEDAEKTPFVLDVKEEEIELCALWDKRRALELAARPRAAAAAADDDEAMVDPVEC